MEGANALMLMITRSFLLDLKDMLAVANQFAAVGRVAAAFPTVYELDYPRDYSLLSQVRTAILVHV